MLEPRSELFNQSLEKGLAVLKAFNAQRRTLNLAEVAEAAAMTKSSAQRMVVTLEALGYLRKQTRTRRYQLTPRVLELGFNYLEAHPLIEVANPFLAELARLTGETCCLTEPVGEEMVYVARFLSAGFVPVHMPIGSRVPQYCTGSGRAYLSALPEVEAREQLERMDRRTHTPATLTAVADILKNLEQTRQQGYAVNAEELFLGDMTLAAPIIDGRGRPVAAVHVVAPTSRWNRADAERQLAPALLQCTRALSGSARVLE
ncbi:IclR family transcriptional regulator [Pseudomonas oryzihabitans]|uniref:IclR family transcriptional regulator n=1 Tax=Pseudomonas oryzihabitans TaxID=47885 RepID=UPI002B1E0EC5|nr:IclR family transcriptional regulator [Pseudomonas oryzihabitans]